MKKQIKQVREFNEAFGLIVNKIPCTLHEVDTLLRERLIIEELQEYVNANWDLDTVEVADAIADILYLTFGLVVAHGLEDMIEEIFDEVHRSNMSKLDEQGRPIYRQDGKVLKGNDYFRPNIKKILSR